MVSSTRVVDKRIKAEEELILSLANEKKLNELKSRFISTASHEFKTPLTVIKSTVELLKKYIEKGKSNINFTDSLNIVNAEVDGLTQLMNDILILEKLDSKKIQFNEDNFDLVDMISGINEKLSQNCNHQQKANIIASSDKIYIDADFGLMNKIVINLLSNAFKYSVGKPDPIVTVHASDHEVVISVKDFGIGIPDADKDQMFTTFFRAKNVSNIEGTGLGLCIVKEFVELHKGTIEVFSKENEGTEFLVHLPK